MEKCWSNIKYIVYKSSPSKVGMGITTTLIKKSYLLKSMLKNIVINWVYYVVIGKRKNKLVQFFVCFHMLCDNKLITRVWTKWCISLISKTFQKHNWLKDGILHMHELVVNRTKLLVEIVRFISLLCDEVTTYDQQSLASIHAWVHSCKKELSTPPWWPCDIVVTM
jgi:hypothetical protein